VVPPLRRFLVAPDLLASDMPFAQPTTPASPSVRERASDVLCSEALAPIVEVVLSHPAPETYEVRAVDGRVRFRREVEGTGWRFELEEVDGRNPVGDQATDRFVGVDTERAGLHPERTANAYPFAYDQVAQFFDAPSAPDLCVVHTAAHNWEDAGGHRGEHGSLDAVQARAPFVIGGAGVRRLGVVPRACRLVDVAPTVLALLGAEPGPGTGRNGVPRDDAYLARQDGDPLLDLLEPGAESPRTVIGFLFDGANPNVLYDMARRGEAPNVARLLDVGTAFEHGAVASLPTVTLANHTGVLTGCFPGHHGILGNAWWDRADAEQVITNSPTTWPTSMRRLDPAVDTIHRAVKRARPGSVSVSINEPCDSYADYSTFELIRRGEPLDRPPGPDDLPHATGRFVRPSKDYRWSSRTDHTAVDQFAGIWSGRHRGVDWDRPAFCWVNFTLTDAAFHEGGPHSEMAAASVRDTDARLGAILDEVEGNGAWDETAFFLVADHGMEETNPAVRGDWGPALAEAGIAYRDEAFGFLYFEG
jgi:phosphonoacetate hydrolase